MALIDGNRVIMWEHTNPSRPVSNAAESLRKISEMSATPDPQGGKAELYTESKTDESRVNANRKIKQLRGRYGL